MSIKRADLDAGRIDFADVTTGKRLPLIHPGEILRDDFLQPLKISVYTLAQDIKVPRSRLNDIVLGRRGITADTAFRLARYFGTTPEFWRSCDAIGDRRSWQLWGLPNCGKGDPMQTMRVAHGAPAARFRNVEMT